MKICRMRSSIRLSSIVCRVDTTGGNHKRAASMGPFPGHLLISKPFHIEVSGLDVNNTYSGRQGYFYALTTISAIVSRKHRKEIIQTF